MKPLITIYDEISEWSQKNFGQQRSKTEVFEVGLRIPFVDAEGIPLPGKSHEAEMKLPIPLGYLASFIGIGEEIGEYGHAVETNNQEEQIDALADIGVYFFDFIARLKLVYPTIVLPVTHLHGNHFGTYQSLPVAYGKLCHTILKRHQAIRNMDDDTLFINDLQLHLNNFAYSLYWYCASIQDRGQESFQFILNNVWEKVSQRDWTKNSKDGSSND